MWDRIDSLLERAPHPEAFWLHRVELLDARRRRAAGLPVGGELAGEEAAAVAHELAAVPLLARVRACVDGPLVLVKGPELALDYPAPRLRRYGDLDLLTDDPWRAQAALLEAGFEEIGEPWVYEDIHHLRPLWWPGLPLAVELHSRPNWPAGLPGPSVSELLETAVPSRLGVPGVQALAPASHAVVLAAHAWAHQPLGRLGNLIDVAAVLQRGSAAEAAALARGWGCERLWKTTHRAIGAVLEGDGRSAGVALWARHLAAVRERTVFEWHLHHLLAPVWGLPAPRAARCALESLAIDGRPLGEEPVGVKVRRAGLALRNAGAPRSAHVANLSERGLQTSTQGDAG